ncbi:6-phosphofructokinase [Hyaloraphidium curvatum]|nr:6-phosphofructokinase [Hyaloraphidium curvatum]
MRTRTGRVGAFRREREACILKGRRVTLAPFHSCFSAFLRYPLEIAMVQSSEFEVDSLGPATIKTPLDNAHIVTDSERVWLHPECDAPDQARLLIAGPRSHMYWNPETVRVGLVTCGGLCPAMNNVIREVVQCLRYRYGVKEKIFGFKFGYWGIANEQYMLLDEEDVKELHTRGGSLIGTSRGNQSPAKMVEVLHKLGINILFAIGGDGTQRGASVIYQELLRRNFPMSVVGIPKSIDNDIAYIDKTFGFETSVELAQPALRAAHEEARSIRHGVGLVKLMGRESGFIALHAALANGDCNMLLLPEVKFTVDDVLDYLQERFKSKDHALIVVAEGAGMDILPPTGKDASGNDIMQDNGIWLRNQINDGLKTRGIKDGRVVYIDPSYSIRAGVANPSDALFASVLAQHCVHVAMAGKTNCLVGRINGQFAVIPIGKAVAFRKHVEPRGLYYQALLDATGMPSSMRRRGVPLVGQAKAKL